MRSSNYVDSFTEESVRRRYDIYQRIREVRQAARTVIYDNNVSRKRRKKLGIDVAYYLREISMYGANFFPEVYILPAIEELEGMLAKISK